MPRDNGDTGAVPRAPWGTVALHHSRCFRSTFQLKRLGFIDRSKLEIKLVLLNSYTEAAPGISTHRKKSKIISKNTLSSSLIFQSCVSTFEPVTELRARKIKSILIERNGVTSLPCVGGHTPVKSLPLNILSSKSFRPSAHIHII